METRPKIILMDTTLRDGEQTQGMSFTPAEKTNLAKALLNNLKVDRIEIASARVSQGELEGVQRTASWAEEKGYLEQIEVLGFVDHTRSVDWIMEAGGRVMNLLTKGSENHCTNQLRKTLYEHLKDIQKKQIGDRKRQREQESGVGCAEGAQIKCGFSLKNRTKILKKGAYDSNRNP